jgi:hypothetical protein
MKVRDIVEGGYASTLTQGTRITPKVVAVAVDAVSKFIQHFNRFLDTKNLPPVKGGNPVGSTFYYKRDLQDNPDKEYGDIDVHFFIPRLPDQSDANNASTYAQAVKEFADSTPGISTDSGRNVIFKIGDNYIQVDLVMAYYDNQEWLAALTPEHNIKGVISSSIYSSLAEYLNLSISTHGVQAKLRGGEPVSFRQSKNTELVTVSKSPTHWALHTAMFIANNKGIKNPEISKDLQEHPGTNTKEIKISDIVLAVKGIGHTLELNGIDSYKNFISNIVRIYTDKITAAIGSSKFDKDTTGKAEVDKQKLQKGLELVQGLFK